MKRSNAYNLIKQTGFGFTAAGAIGTCCLSLCACLNQGVIVALIFTILFTLSSIKKNSLFAPSPLFAVVFFFALQFNSLTATAIIILLGSITSLALNKIVKGKPLPDFITGGCFVGLALCATILFTNSYFGIGATGFTPLDMLKSYRSLGFHPDFRGLLYGTITLFTMITYPFKFRRLKTIVPPEFITIFIPFVLNLLLNPNPSYTTTNEYSDIDLYSMMFDYTSATAIWRIFFTGVATGFVIYVLSQKSNDKAMGFFTATPVIPCNNRSFTGIAPLVTILVCAAVILINPTLISRLPLPCAGAMLIVSAWQQVPFKSISSVMKGKSVISLFAMIVCGGVFVVLPLHGAVPVCAVIWVLTKIIPCKKEVEV